MIYFLAVYLGAGCAFAFYGDASYDDWRERLAQAFITAVFYAPLIVYYGVVQMVRRCRRVW